MANNRGRQHVNVYVYFGIILTHTSTTIILNVYMIGKANEGQSRYLKKSGSTEKSCRLMSEKRNLTLD